MRFKFDDVLAFPAEQIFERACQELDRLADVLPHVRAISPVSAREVGGGLFERVDHWFARAATHHLPIDQASWTVTSRWHAADLVATWDIDVLEPQDGATSTGRMAIQPLSDSSARVEVEGEVSVMGHALPLATRALAIAFAPLAERIVGHIIEQNMAALLGGVEGMLAAPLRVAS